MIVTKYIVVSGSNLIELIESVNEKIAIGYQPFGSLAIGTLFSDNSGKIYAQAMVI